jgi:3-isopropylmalate/(R)-2-methylmalate dehydratase large subunit
MDPVNVGAGVRAGTSLHPKLAGRQGRGGRTHLVSPAVAAATAIAGHFAEPADLD